MDINKLIGKRVWDKNRHSIGVILSIKSGIVEIDYHGNIVKKSFPSAFASFLEFEDEDIQKELQSEGISASFDDFKRCYGAAIQAEIDYLKANGGKRYRIVDGEQIPSQHGEYIYAFDTDTDLHFPDGTIIKLWFPDYVVSGYVVSCEEFTLVIKTAEFIGDHIDSVEFTSEQWQLLEALMERIDEMEPDSNSIAYQIACTGKSQIYDWSRIRYGQNTAFSRAATEKITFIWGPPGTGKTETLANIALEHIQQGKRVLMLSYSNVSVDGALLRVAKKADLPAGSVIRYGYPRTKELLESETLTSYQYVLSRNPEKSSEYKELIEKKKKLKRKKPERIAINKKLSKIRDYFLEQEKELIQQSAFVATTASKATVDRAVYTQSFDAVIFDEASMAYVPQIVFSSGMAKSHFICIGDFCQLPAIVQNNLDDRLSKDIFEYVGITSAVNNNCCHEWLVMLDLQYRMHPDIAEFASANMYQGKLKTSDKIIESRSEIAKCHPCPNSAMAMVDLSGLYSVCTKTMDGSRINIFSALVCLRLAEKNMERYEVGIITPYSAQSRLLLSMIRDLQENDSRWQGVSCATVHQFQGSEKPVIIYDAVDCYRMSFPGTLLTAVKNDSANRLFNVALTRAKGKFMLVANFDYFYKKKISAKLLFTKAMKRLQHSGCWSQGEALLNELRQGSTIIIGEKEKNWKRFLDDISDAKSEILIDIPDVIEASDNELSELVRILSNKKISGVNIRIRCPENIDLPDGLQHFLLVYKYTANPITIIDRQITWFGQPLYAADFISDGDILPTAFFPSIRFCGRHTARSILAFLEM